MVPTLLLIVFQTRWKNIYLNCNTMLPLPMTNIRNIFREPQLKLHRNCKSKKRNGKVLKTLSRV